MAGEDKPDNKDEAAPGSKHIELWKDAVKLSSKIVGGAAGLGTVSVTHDPFSGLLASATVATAVEKAGLNVIQRLLGPRQNARVAKALTVAAVRMEERVNVGETPRTDSFAQPGPDGRSDAEEVVEATLFAAMNSAEEKKVEFLGLLLANIAFDPLITAADAQMMIETAESLRYRAYVVLKIANDVRAYHWPERGDFNVAGPPGKFHPLMSQVYDMTRRGLIEMKGQPTDNALDAVLGVDDIDPARMHLSPFGKALYINMELHRLPDTDETYVQTVGDLKTLSGYGKGATMVTDGAF